MNAGNGSVWTVVNGGVDGCAARDQVITLEAADVTTMAGTRPEPEGRGAGQPEVRLPAVDVTPRRRYSGLEDACAGEYPRLVRLLTLYCGDRETALDLAQETLARGCVHWDR